MLIWVFITAAVVMGWGGLIGLSLDYVSDYASERCRAGNAQMVEDERQGPLQPCAQ